MVPGLVGPVRHVATMRRAIVASGFQDLAVPNGATSPAAQKALIHSRPRQRCISSVLEAMWWMIAE
jgi:hypothetical protein